MKTAKISEFVENAAPQYALTHQHATSGTAYWCVHFSRKGKRQYKRFYEPKYGGSDKALAAAIAWRDEQLAEADVLTMAEFCSQKRTSNTSGVPGVHFMKSAAQPLGFWQAKLKSGGGKYLSQSFSVLKHGDSDAFGLAVAARLRMLESVGDQAYLQHPTARELSKKPPRLKRAGD